MKNLLLFIPIALTVLLSPPPNQGLRDKLIGQGFTMPATTDSLPYTEITPVQNWEAAVEVGALLYTDNSLSIFGQTSCAASCHVPGNHLSPKGEQIGAGGVWTASGRQKLKYFPDDLIVDAPPFNAPSAENVIYIKRVLHDCVLTVQSQISQDAGSFIHSINWAAIKENPIYEHYFNIAYGTPETNEIRFIQSISAYQESHISNQVPFQKWLRGEKELSNRSMKAITLMDDKKCFTCHSGPDLSGGGFIMSDPVKPNKMFRSDSVKVRQLYNMDAYDKYGWAGEYKSLYAFLKKHRSDLSRKDAKEIKRVLLREFTD